MKVKAKTNIKFDGDWKETGTLFDVDAADFAFLGELVEAVEEEPAAQPAPANEEKPAEAETAPEETEAKPKTAAARRRTTAKSK